MCNDTTKSNLGIEGRFHPSNKLLGFPACHYKITIKAKGVAERVQDIFGAVVLLGDDKTLETLGRGKWSDAEKNLIIDMSIECKKVLKSVEEKTKCPVCK